MKRVLRDDRPQMFVDMQEEIDDACEEFHGIWAL
jgi:hypothetical protein